MRNLTSRDKWNFGKFDDLLHNKDDLIFFAITSMIGKCIKIFEYKGLPKTINHKDLEMILQVNGNATIKEVDGKLYAFNAGLGGEPNPYYLPTKAIIANPALKYNKTLDIDKDCVVILNDYLYQGLMPIHKKYGALLIEAELSLKQAILNARIPALVEADNDNAHASAEEFFKKIVAGADYGIIASKAFFEGVKTQPFYNQPYIKDIIESIQYIKGSWWAEIGLNSNYNMKREALSEHEINANDDILFPIIDEMLDCRKQGVEKVNAMYNTNISVDFSSSWKNLVKQQKLDFEIQESDIEVESET